MKANELRIGNYVELRGKTTTIWKVSTQTIHVIPYDSPMEDEIKPIPLTEQWLLYFGFEPANAYDISKCIFFRKGILDITLNCHGVYVGIQRITDKIEYVHQLQNLYFALTGKELKLSKK